jgi:hypothetical protein
MVCKYIYVCVCVCVYIYIYMIHFPEVAGYTVSVSHLGLRSLRLISWVSFFKDRVSIKWLMPINFHMPAGDGT